MTGSKTVFHGNGWTLVKLDRSPFYYVVSHEKGKDRLSKSTGSAHIGEAKKLAAELHRAYLLQAKRETVAQNRLDSPKILEDAWAKYLSLEKAKITTGDLDESTFVRKVNAWERMEYFWGSEKLEFLNQSNFILFSAEHEHKYPNCSLQNEHKYLTALANFMHETGLVAKKPKLILGKEKSKARGERSKLTDKQIKSLFVATEICLIRTALLINLGIFAGMRISEIAKLQTKNIIFKSGKCFLKLEDTKTDKNRTVQVNAHCALILKEALEVADGRWLLLNGRDSSKHIPLQTLDTDWRKLFESVGLRGRVFHELRHTAISAAVQKYDLAKVSLYYGVSLKTLMATYVHLDEFEIGEVSGAVEL